MCIYTHIQVVGSKAANKISQLKLHNCPCSLELLRKGKGKELMEELLLLLS